MLWGKPTHRFLAAYIVVDLSWIFVILSAAIGTGTDIHTNPETPTSVSSTLSLPGSRINHPTMLSIGVGSVLLIMQNALAESIFGCGSHYLCLFWFMRSYSSGFVATSALTGGRFAFTKHVRVSTQTVGDVDC